MVGWTADGHTYASAASMRASARSRSTSVMASLRAACQSHSQHLVFVRPEIPFIPTLVLIPH